MSATDLALDDPDALREQALVLLRGLAGETWTDHNAHDPGITLLEALCYALTDLGYRADHPVADLMAEHDAPGAPVDPAAHGLWTAAQVLSGGAVTPDDLRRLIIDVPGVKNAWIELLQAPLARHDGAQNLVLPLDPSADGVGEPGPNITELRPQGLVAVRIEKSGLGEDIDGGSIVRGVAQRVHRWRPLGLDVVAVELLETQRVPLSATLDIAPEADPVAVLAAAITALADHLSPPVPFRSLREMQARGWRVDQVFDGPPLQHGFLDRVEFDALARRSSVRLSDLVQVLMSVPGVRAVPQLAFLVDGRPSGDWLLAIAPGRSAALDLDGSLLRLERRQLRLDDDGVRAAARRRVEAGLRERAAAMAAAATGGAHDLPLPDGRSRRVGRYRSVQHHLPRVYGVGPDGLPASASAERRAQAAQLKAYLLFFDQLLANQHAQLAGVSRLLAFDAAAQQVLDTSFAEPVADEAGPTGASLGLDALRRGSPDEHARRLRALAADPTGQGDARDPLLHRHRQADHLLARAGERLVLHPPRPDRIAEGQGPQAVLLRDKLTLLRSLPQLGRRRGAGADALADAGALATEPADESTLDGLSQRLALSLGLGLGLDVGDEAETEPFRLVEHILLRPLPEDAAQDGPLIHGAVSADPYSLQLTAALAVDAGRLADADFRRLVEQTLRDHLPVHLGLRVLWLDGAAMRALAAAHDRWWPLWCASRREAFGLSADTAAAAAGRPWRQWPLRSARNRLIDQLGLGDTAPLTDLPVGGVAEGPIKVPHGGPARIAISHAELGVRYALRGPGGQPLRDARGQVLPAITADGDGGTAMLDSPPVTDDITFRVLATKLGSAQPPRLLSQPVPVKVGLDTTLAVDAPDAPWLDPLLPSPQPADARLVPWGTRLTVTVQASQEGVSYALVLDGQVQAESTVGDLATLSLVTPPLAEDTLIAVQASKAFTGGGGRSQDVQLLDARLTVCVRANPALAVTLLPAGVADFHAAGLRLQVAGAQASARYAVALRRVPDREFVRDAATGTPGLLACGVEGLPQVPMPPAAAADGPPPDGFELLPTEALADGGVAGDGQQAVLPLPALGDDAVLLVAATKQHQPVGQARAITSRVWLAQPALLLRRPDPARRLALQWWQGADGHTLALQGGQPGVFYQPLSGPPADAPVDGSTDAALLPVSLPGYFHQRDVAQPARNKGVDQLGLGIDLVIAADPPVRPDPGVDALDTLPPQPPSLRLATAPKAGSRLHWRAIKAQTGLDAMLAVTTTHGVVPVTTPIGAMPALTLAPAFPAPGVAGELQVAASDATQRYQLLPATQTLPPDPAAGQPGNGKLLSLKLPPLQSDTLLALWVQDAAEPDAKTLPMARVQPVAVRVLPRDDLGLRADAASVAAGQGTWLRVADSQPGVLYQLSVAGQALGEAVAGTGAELGLPTGAIAAETEFGVTATRADAVQASVRLQATVRVMLEAP